VTIENGRIEGFDRGIYVVGGSRNLIRNTEIRSVYNTGIRVEQAPGTRIENNDLIATGPSAIWAMFVYQSPEALIEGNRIAKEGDVNGFDRGISVPESDRVTVERNTVRSTSFAIELHQLSGARVSGNNVSGNPPTFVGISTGGGTTGSRIDGNTLEDMFVGISIGQGGDNRITRNVVSGAGLGDVCGGEGISLHGAYGNTFDRNRVSGPFVHGFVVYADVHAYVPNLRIDRNDVSRICRNGSQGTTPASCNPAAETCGDGFVIQAPGAVLTGNHAFFNGNLGFDAVNGVVNGGGNLAKHNGNPAQCVPSYLCSTTGKPKK
jgi:parallel beta-helix repeat protein